MFTKKSHIHFVGIGGIGMSGIATILRYQGYIISGCDRDLHQQSIANLKNIGCQIFEGNNTPACHQDTIDILVYSSAIKNDNPEIIAAQQRGIPTIPRALMLAELMRTKYSIAIAGSHGKTTTTSLISHLLIEAGIDPTVIIGGHLKSISTNARFGSGEFLVAEADESDRSLTRLQATLAVITNIDLEHLETYKDLDDIKQTFVQFLNNLPFYGRAILCIDDPVIQSLLPLPHIKTILYGLSARADYFATNVTLQPDCSTFTAHYREETLGNVSLSMPGNHNVLNALAAISICQQLGIPFGTIANALTSFQGVERRFSYRGRFQGAELFDDYGHHPKEIACTLEVARRRTKNKLIVVFQPHRYTRTHHLWQQFIDVFKGGGIDQLIITDIYPASESPIPGVTGKRLAQCISSECATLKVAYFSSESDFNEIRSQITQQANSGDLVLMLGAGKIYILAKELAEK